jgi:hypothetical protein
VDFISSDGFDAARFTGGAITGELLFGGTPARGLVIGGGTNGATVIAPHLDVDGDSASPPDVLALSLVGPFLVYYPDPERGTHLQLLAGYGLLQADRSSFAESPDGFGVSLGVGHEAFVSEQWSIGILGRLMGAVLSYSPNGENERHVVLVPGTIATLTLH